MWGAALPPAYGTPPDHGNRRHARGGVARVAVPGTDAVRHAGSRRGDRQGPAQGCRRTVSNRGRVLGRPHSLPPARTRARTPRLPGRSGVEVRASPSRGGHRRNDRHREPHRRHRDLIGTLRRGARTARRGPDGTRTGGRAAGIPAADVFRDRDRANHHAGDSRQGSHPRHRGVHDQRCCTLIRPFPVGAGVCRTGREQHGDRRLRARGVRRSGHR